MTSAFSELLTRPLLVQMLWLVWRDEQLRQRPREYFIENAECPLAMCQAIKGERCRSASGRATYHESRLNEYLADEFLRQEIAKPGHEHPAEQRTGEV